MDYDIKVLIEKLKTKGIDLAEKAARDAVNEVFDWVTESVKTSSTPFDDVLLLVLPKAKEMALKEVDKIDGKVNV